MTDIYKEINKPDEDQKIWVQTLLYHELVSYFAFQIFKILMLIHIRKSYCHLLASHPHWAYLWSYQSLSGHWQAPFHWMKEKKLLFQLITHSWTHWMQVNIKWWMLTNCSGGQVESQETSTLSKF